MQQYLFLFLLSSLANNMIQPTKFAIFFADSWSDVIVTNLLILYLLFVMHYTIE